MDQFFRTIQTPGVAADIDLNQYASFVEMFERTCKRFYHQPAFTAYGYTLTYRELIKLTHSLAGYIQNKTNLKPGDRIAIMMPNILAYPVVLYSCLRAGLIVVNTNPDLSTRELESQFNDAGVKGLFIQADLASKVEEILPDTAISNVVITKSGDLLPSFKRAVVNVSTSFVAKGFPNYHIPGAIRLKKAIDIGRQYLFEPVTIKPDDIALIQYSAGTTSGPKGAMLTQQNLVASVLQAKAAFKPWMFDGREVVFAPLSLYHIYPFMMHCGVFFEMGGHNILIPDASDIESVVYEFATRHISVFVGMASLFSRLINDLNFREVDFSTLKLTTSGGTVLPGAVARSWRQLTGSQVAEGYGMSETSSFVTFNPLNSIQSGTVGLPMQHTEIRVIDDEGKPLSPGEVGELCVKGPQVMKGYWQRPEERIGALSEDGWLKTGDLAIIQNDDYVRIIDRKKDLIKVSGFNICPKEVEEIVISHNKVDECAALGVPDKKTGQVVKLFVVVNDPQFSKNALLDFCNERMTAYKVPKYIEFIDDLPKSNVGKVLRSKLVQVENTQTSRPRTGKRVIESNVTIGDKETFEWPIFR